MSLTKRTLQRACSSCRTIWMISIRKRWSIWQTIMVILVLFFCSRRIRIMSLLICFLQWREKGSFSVATDFQFLAKEKGRAKWYPILAVKSIYHGNNLVSNYYYILPICVNCRVCPGTRCVTCLERCSMEAGSQMIMIRGSSTLLLRYLSAIFLLIFFLLVRDLAWLLNCTF